MTTNVFCDGCRHEAAFEELPEITTEADYMKLLEQGWVCEDCGSEFMAGDSQ